MLQATLLVLCITAHASGRGLLQDEITGTPSLLIASLSLVRVDA